VGVDIFAILFVLVLIDGIRTGVLTPKEGVVWGVVYVVLRACLFALAGLEIVFSSLASLEAILILIRVYGSNLIRHY